MGTRPTDDKGHVGARRAEEEVCGWWMRRGVPPFSLHVVALVALLHLPNSQIRMQPVEFLRLEVLEQEAVTPNMLYVGSQAAADQD